MARRDGYGECRRAFDHAVIFLGGILLGVARATSNSVYLTIGLHSLMNVVATVELWVYLWSQS
jgi:membrane protease YdiL (CAAX protease family)